MFDGDFFTEWLYNRSIYTITTIGSEPDPFFMEEYIEDEEETLNNDNDEY